MKVTKVLVVDDSALMRRTLGQILRDAGMEVEMARNGVEAVDRLVQYHPDVVTLDVNMPEMDGLTSLSLMMQVRPTPVVMVSSLTEKGAMATLEALALGAVDCIAKPGGTISLNIEQVALELVTKVRAAAQAKPRAGARQRLAGQRRQESRGPCVRNAGSVATEAVGATRATAGEYQGLVLMGVSTGGPRTLEDILPHLPAHCPWPVLLAQHMPANFTQVLARRMDGLCAVHVCEVDRPTRLAPGHVYVARGGTDMVVARASGGELVARPVPESCAYAWHPSVSRLVESAMQVVDPSQLIGVLLTGMGDDGAQPMAELRRRGGRTVAESRETAVVYGMPQELVARNGATVQLPCDRIASQLCQWLGV
ncbi:chemotaxis-specific protein-glutamate methyltransferase CheB [Acidovorax lacteus]|uniref:Protein-glutamate methylesterase/protein-glutamine glutaminase n=1 Tax=Acidovorax lacteus TaxID=1924988 RepID=A0ABP8L801_9BURK